MESGKIVAQYYGIYVIYITSTGGVLPGRRVWVSAQLPITSWHQCCCVCYELIGVFSRHRLHGLQRRIRLERQWPGPTHRVAVISGDQH